ncbi:hypothetical protein KAJ89_05550 [Candidatus Parcubacteria bacterium]|nr:hypothetical protein [Candidatus Parcubacteria bacterium]
MEFFAVTTTSLYRVSDERDKESSFPIVEKIAIKPGKKSGVSVGTRLKNGHLIGVTPKGIILYDEDHPRSGQRQKPEMVNTAFWGGHTSPIVALFIDKNEAIACLNAKNTIDPSDWVRKTDETLKAISNSNSIFVLSSFIF